ncbi:MAG: ASCH domain-containing protein [Gammaproteobacteria bacterium]|nr:ASCH domain-containing protein [Gammaproteobacteria bacterium]
MTNDAHELDHDIADAATNVSRGLIIDQPWIGKILRGEKTWEMRSRRTSIRGPIALIEKGSGTVVGVASIVDSLGPLSLHDISENLPKHRVEPEIHTKSDYKWNHAWVLDEVIPLSYPVKYRHKPGAVIWVELDDAAREALQKTFMGVFPRPSKAVSDSTPASVQGGTDQKIPYARDGSSFCRESCNRNGYFTVGDKGSEQRFANYSAALEYLKRMPTAKWRRPNPKGNWGIVSAIGWKDA